MDDHAPPILRLILVPTIVTLAVTVLRLVGELQSWSPLLVGDRTAGGGGALLGISWLIFVFGLWFGIRVQCSGHGVTNPGRTLLVAGIALAVTAGAMATLQALDLLFVPDADHRGEPRGVAWFIGTLLVGVAICVLAWPRVAVALLAYGYLARLPVILVTWLCLENGWDTHYVKIDPSFPQPEAGQELMMLTMPQLTFWPLVTVLAGTPVAGLGALVCRRRATRQSAAGSTPTP